MTKPPGSRDVRQLPAESPEDIGSMDGFNAAMRKIAKVSKEEIERRERAERDAKQAAE